MPKHAINRQHFFNTVRSRLFNGTLKQPQVSGLTAILDEWERGYSTYDDRYLAYMLATAFHETAATMQPIEEYGKGRGRKYGLADPATGHCYYGRGYVQLTWKYNYESCGKLLKKDLVREPKLALDPHNAAVIMFQGMIKGIFTGKKLANYFTPSKSDWVTARKIINGLDRAQLIAGYGQQFYSAISYMQVA